MWVIVAGVSRFWSGSSAACSLLCHRLHRREEVSTDPRGMRAGPLARVFSHLLKSLEIQTSLSVVLQYLIKDSRMISIQSNQK